MTAVTLSLASLAGRTGRGVRIAVIDSGVHGAHPHIGGLTGAVAFDDDGRRVDDVIDRLGHGTAVAAAIHDKAPDAELLSVKVFDRTLSATGRALVAAIQWAAASGASLINLSLGTTNPEHAPALDAAVRAVQASGALVIAAAPDGHANWLPGALAGVVGVELDWTCARDRCTIAISDEPRVRIRASGYPRPIPGVPPEQNVKGQSFAVANATGLLALATEGARVPSIAEVVASLSPLSLRLPR